MRKPPNIRINTEGFRAINKADIIIDGITLVAGENGCGKSTISKLLYFLYKTVSNYDLLVKNQLYKNLQDVLKFLDILVQEITQGISDRKIRDEFRKEITDLRRNMYREEFLEDELENWIGLITKIESFYTNTSENKIKTGHLPKLIRLKYIISDILKNESPDEDIAESFIKIKLYVRTRFKEADGKIKFRPTSLFIEELKNVFSEDKLPEKFEISEYDDLIVSIEKQNLSIPFNIQNVIYIDTPMMISISDGHNKHWEDLNEILLEKRVFTPTLFQDNPLESNVGNIISTEIINGDIDIDDSLYNSEILKFKRKDGEVFNLLDVATGVKSFSILKLLIKNGALNDKTLLIIDEPESNLHPQWIVEYARIIVLLNKELGVKFFLASHNPDMVSAIRYISEKENILENIHFYLAQKIENKFIYDYIHLDKNIDPIFESFNISIDRINKYGI